MKKNNLFPLLLTAEQREHIERESERKKVSKAEVVRRLLDDDIKSDIITEAKKVNERIISEAYTTFGTRLKDYLINEFGKFIYEVNFEIEHYPTPADPNTGWLAGHEVTNVNVELLKIYDTEGDLVPFTKEQKSKIENSFKNLEYEII